MREFTSGIMIAFLITIGIINWNHRKEQELSEVPLQILAVENQAPTDSKKTDTYLILTKNLNVIKLEVSDGAVQKIQAPTKDEGWRTTFAQEPSEESEMTTDEAQAMFGKILILPRPAPPIPETTLAEPG